MSGVTYHGEYPEGQENEDGKRFIEHQGYTFVEGKSVDVKDKHALAKLAANRFFKTADSNKGEVEQGKDEAEQAEIATLRAWLAENNVPAHHKLGVDKLRDLKANHLKAEQEASEG